MKPLVTGAAGFIGSGACRWLLDRGDSVVGLDNLNDYYDHELKYGRLATLGIGKDDVSWYKFMPGTTDNRFRFIRMNLEDTQAIQMLFVNERFDAVIHLVRISSSTSRRSKTAARSSAAASSTISPNLRRNPALSSPTVAMHRSMTSLTRSTPETSSAQGLI